VLLWYPSYVEQVTKSDKRSEFSRFCHHSTPENVSLYDYCGCDGASFSDQHFSNTHFANFHLNLANFHNVQFTNVTFTDSLLESCNFTNCTMENVVFGERTQMVHVGWYATGFVGVNVTGLSSCEGEVIGGGGGEVGSGEFGELVRVLEGGNATSCEGVRQVECEGKEEGSVYRDLFFVAASASVGNIASAIGVYFMRRNYWMGQSAHWETSKTGCYGYME
jgi:hypothetical protein